MSSYLIPEMQTLYELRQMANDLALPYDYFYTDAQKEADKLK